MNKSSTIVSKRSALALLAIALAYLFAPVDAVKPLVQHPATKFVEQEAHELPVVGFTQEGGDLNVEYLAQVRAQAYAPGHLPHNSIRAQSGMNL